MNFMVTLDQTLVLFILLLIGFIVKRLRIVDDSFSKNLSNLLFYIVMPTMIVHAMNYPFSFDALINSGWLALAGFGVLIFSGIVALIVVKWMKVDPLSRNIYEFGMIFSNFGFMGFPLIEALWGKEGIFYASVFNIPIFILVNSWGIMLIKRGREKSMKVDFKSVINPPVIAVIVGLAMFVFQVKLPKPVEMSIGMVADTTTPLSMILAGILLANASFKKMFLGYRIYLVSFIRLIFLPLCILLFMRMIHMNAYMVDIPVMITAMPVAANASILAERYEGDAYLGAQCVFLSTFLSILTIPLIALLL